MHKAKWEHFDPPADMGIRGMGPTCADALVQGARALTAVLLPLEEVEPQPAIPVHGRGAARDYLYVDWLNALIKHQTRCTTTTLETKKI